MGIKNIRIIVPCHDSDKTIERCISSIFRSEGIDFELFIIDDGKNNRIALLSDRYPVEVVKTTGQVGAGRARNLGASGFKGKLLVFIDSDVQVYADTLKALVKPIEENIAEATAGSYSKEHLKNFYQAYKHLYLAYRYGTKQRYLTNTFWSAICAIDHKAFIDVNGFKECYPGAGLEDIELGMELSLAGARILSVPQAEGIHLAEFGFIGLLENDLKKGTEDIYIHWIRKVPLRHNRHATRADIISVFIACFVPVLLILHYAIGIVPALISIFLYFILRIKFVLSAFGEEDLLFIIRSILLTYLLDVLRGFAVLKGTLVFVLEILSSGKFKPFIKLSI